MPFPEGSLGEVRGGGRKKRLTLPRCSCRAKRRAVRVKIVPAPSIPARARWRASQAPHPPPTPQLRHRHPPGTSTASDQTARTIFLPRLAAVAAASILWSTTPAATFSRRALEAGCLLRGIRIDLHMSPQPTLDKFVQRAHHHQHHHHHYHYFHCFANPANPSSYKYPGTSRHPSFFLDLISKRQEKETPSLREKHRWPPYLPSSSLLCSTLSVIRVTTRLKKNSLITFPRQSPTQ